MNSFFFAKVINLSQSFALDAESQKYHLVPKLDLGTL